MADHERDKVRALQDLARATNKLADEQREMTRHMKQFTENFREWAKWQNPRAQNVFSASPYIAPKTPDEPSTDESDTPPSEPTE